MGDLHSDDDATREGPPEVAYRRGRSPFRAAPKDSLLERALPVSGEISDYRPRTARRDLLAGVTVAALALPSGMAYAEVAGRLPSTASTPCSCRPSCTCSSARRGS